MEPPSKLSHGERWLASEGWSWAWSCRAFVAVVQREASYCRCFSQSSLLPPCRRGGGRRVAQSERGRKHRSRGERGETCAGHRRFCRSEPCCRHRKTLSPPSRSRGGRKSHWVTPHLASTALSPKTTTESTVLVSVSDLKGLLSLLCILMLRRCGVIYHMVAYPCLHSVLKVCSYLVLSFQCLCCCKSVWGCALKLPLILG